MILKKFYGSTINEAVRVAKEQLGEQIILLESVPPSGERRAAVTVMMDQKLESVTPETKAPKQEEPKQGEPKEDLRTQVYKRSDVRPAKNQSQPRQEDEEDQVEQQTTRNQKQSAGKSAPLQSLEEEPPTEEKPPETPKKSIEEEAEQRQPTGLADENVDEEAISRHHGSLMNKVKEAQNESGVENGTVKDAVVSREVAALHKRFDQVEAMMGEALISANLEYASHPAFQQLMDAGVRATTISGWFRQILDQGIDPNEDSESFMYQLARIVRDALTITMPEPVQKNLVFAGASGAGKTSLIMKLAANEEFMGDKKVAVISVEPRSLTNYYTVLEPFAADHEIPFHRVRDGIDASKLIKKFDDYDHVLFDTPSISLEKKTAFREYWKVRQILASVNPVEIHFVVNATMENYYFREAYATNHPLQPDYVAITHLDETRRWGHLIPFLKTLGCSVRYMSLGPTVPDDVNAFSPTWFAEKILSSQ